MSPRASDQLFACPFCQAASVAVIGRGGKFVHYRCEVCAEVWTGMRFSEAEAAMAGRLERPAARKDVRKH
jgi:transposase-like protein